MVAKISGSSILWVSKCFHVNHRERQMKSWESGGSMFLTHHGTQRLLYSTLAMIIADYKQIMGWETWLFAVSEDRLY